MRIVGKLCHRQSTYYVIVSQVGFLKGTMAHSAQRGMPHLVALTGRRIEFDGLHLIRNTLWNIKGRS